MLKYHVKKFKINYCFSWRKKTFKMSQSSLNLRSVTAFLKTFYGIIFSLEVMNVIEWGSSRGLEIRELPSKEEMRGKMNLVTAVSYIA